MEKVGDNVDANLRELGDLVAESDDLWVMTQLLETGRKQGLGISNGFGQYEGRN